MYNAGSYATPRKRVQHSDQNVDDRPIQEFCKVIETVPSDQWTQRCAAFQKLVSDISDSPSPTRRTVNGGAANGHGNGDSTVVPWYKSPKTLRHLTLPLAELLKDGRSTVVKRTCDSAAQLFDKCRSDARYLMKDIMPTIIGVHAQTVQVIKASVQAMVCEALQVVPCKAAMPLWLERLKSDRSRSVREASALYLRVSLNSWQEEEGYLTDDIWMQVGACLIRALRDPSQSVREYVKQSLHICRLAKPELWLRMIDDPNGPASRDAKIRRFLNRLGDHSAGPNNAHNEELSVTSRASWVSTTSTRSMARGGGMSVSSRRSGLGPPVRISATPSSVTAPSSGFSSPSPSSVGRGKTRSPMRAGARSPPPPTAVSTSFSPSPMSSSGVPTGGRGAYGASTPQTRSIPTPNGPSPAERFTFNEADETNVTSGSGTGNTDCSPEAKEHRRKSALLKEKWRRSSVGERDETGDGIETNGGVTTNEPAIDSVPEHTRIAQQLLEYHRKHLDQVMEVLRTEMDAMREFEALVTDSDGDSPTDSQVLDYFVQLGTYLDSRMASGKKLQEFMDVISTEDADEQDQKN